MADYSKRSFDQSIKTMENLLSAKSLDKAFDVQTDYARAAYEGYVSQATNWANSTPTWAKKLSSRSTILRRR